MDNLRWYPERHFRAVKIWAVTATIVLIASLLVNAFLIYILGLPEPKHQIQRIPVPVQKEVMRAV